MPWKSPVTVIIYHDTCTYSCDSDILNFSFLKKILNNDAVIQNIYFLNAGIFILENRYQSTVNVGLPRKLIHIDIGIMYKKKGHSLIKSEISKTTWPTCMTLGG